MDPLYKIKLTLRELAAYASECEPHGVGFIKGYEPDRQDGRDFIGQLVEFAMKVDDVIEAYGDCLESLGVVGARDVRIYFTSVLLSALEGNALFAIEDGIEQRIEEAAQ